MRCINTDRFKAEVPILTVQEKTSEHEKSIIAITAGEPAGIGPDICIKIAQRQIAALVVIADPDMLRNAPHA